MPLSANPSMHLTQSKFKMQKKSMHTSYHGNVTVKYV